MTRTLLTLGLLSAAMLAACAGDPPDQLLMPIPDTPDDPQQQNPDTPPEGAAFDYYKSNVHDLLVQECSTCHDQGGTAGLPWMDTSDVQTSYNTMQIWGGIIESPDCSELNLKSLGTHSGPSLSPTAEKEVRAWLTLEATAADLSCDTGTQPTVDSCEALLEQFQGCMHIEHWDGVGMDNVPNQQTEGDGPCYGCHSQGVGSAFLNQDSTLAFEAHKTDRYFLQKLVGCAYSGGQAVGLVATDRYLNKGSEPCAQQPCHPDFLMSTTRQQAIATYVQEVQDAIAAGTCDDLANYPQ